MNNKEKIVIIKKEKKKERKQQITGKCRIECSRPLKNQSKRNMRHKSVSKKLGQLLDRSKKKKKKEKEKLK